jgi:hypothetical protein
MGIPIEPRFRRWAKALTKSQTARFAPMLVADQVKAVPSSSISRT